MHLFDYIHDLGPEWILLIGACVALLFGIGRASGAGRVSGPIALITVLVALAVTLWVGVPAVGRDHPPGLLLTPFVYYVRLGGLVVGAFILLCNLHVPVAEERGEYFGLILFSLLGLLLTAAANDLIVLFFSIELVSVPTYVLIALSREDRRASEASLKYFFLGAIAAALMVYGFSFLYGVTGHMTLTSADGIVPAMSTKAAAMPGLPIYVVIGLLLAFAGFFFKIAAVPFHVYAPDVYEGAASPVTGLLGFLPKFAGFVAAARLLSVFGWDVGDAVLWLLWIVSLLTMTVGNTLALLQTNVKRILAYSSIAHSGYMLIGLLVGPALVATAGPMRDGVAAMLFYMVVYGTMNLGAFAVLAALSNKGEAVEELHDLEGLATRRPGLALALAICVFSLMGFPPTAGLLGKVYIFTSAFSVGAGHAFAKPLVVLAIIGVINSAIGAAYYLRIAAACYNRPPRIEPQRSGGVALRVGLGLCAAAMIVLFVFPTLLTGPAKTAANNLLPPAPAPAVAARE